MDENKEEKKGRNLIDEESLLSNTFASLKDDSEQKQKFEAAYYEAEAANKAKSAFLSNMSHDIRTPMNAIVGMTEIALKYLDDPQYVKECLGKVSAASQYLLDIINNVLDMSRIESGKFRLAEEEIELPKLVYGMITILNQSLDVKSLNLSVEVDRLRDEVIIGDGVRLTQVLMNILTNSVKFTPTGGSIGLCISQTESAEDGYGDYTFVITDTGMGMSQEFVSKVFDTFTRDSKAELSRIEGTGLGMAIAKNFVELMGGTVQCKSELGKGTEFTVNMHLKIENQTAYPETGKYDSMKILILADNEKECISQKKCFEAAGVMAEYVLDIERACELIEHGRENKNGYDFVIINQSAEDKSGLNALNSLPKPLQEEELTYVLAARDLLSIEQSTAYNAGITAFVQIPLFKSTVIGILDRSIELQDSGESDCIPDLEGFRVLLVEDNEINRQIANLLISETKADIVEAANGKEAIEQFKEHEPGYFDVIMMDVQMPVMNGYEATMAIRSMRREDAESIPIFAMTANTFDEDVRQVAEAGMNGHLGKPYVPNDLYVILNRALLKR